MCGIDRGIKLLVWTEVFISMEHIKLDLNVWYGQRYLLVWNTLN